MNGVVVIDTNLLLLYIVGLASPDYISKHKRLNAYSVDDFELLGLIIASFSEIVTLPHILSETSNFIRHIENPALARIQSVFKAFIERTIEIPAMSLQGAEREEFKSLGLTDAMILYFCGLSIDGAGATLLTADTRLADRANLAGYSVIDYKQSFQQV
jgi:hypothetical protein